MNRDIDWTLRFVRHVNRKLEAHKEESRAWASQEEERSVQEWYAQDDINKRLKLENEKQKCIIESQQRQIEHLYQMINDIYGEREMQEAQDRSRKKQNTLPESVKEEQ